ncbi:MAG: NAD-dependent epimerase/dehydratase family protein [Bacteroidetes bacterium]|nr:NAD-dependent epimerase/dehydratase family protein [Bacteroidota bacterium]
MKDKSILIVGGAGFVGSNLVKQVLKMSPANVTIVDNLLSADISNIPDDDRIIFLKGSITDENILAQIKDEYNYIFHLATFHGNQNSIFDPLADHANNTYTTLRLFEHIKEFKNIEKVVYSSAGCSVAKKTYDSAEATPEDAPIGINQDSPYSISKVIGEFYSAYYFKQHKLPVVRARFQNVYGPGEILGAGEWRGTIASVWRNVTPTFIYKALKGQELPLENNGDASRDFIFVEDICRGLIACAQKGRVGEVYNIASGVEISIKNLAETIISLTGNKASIKLLPKRNWDTSGKRFGSTEKSKEQLDFSAQVNLKEGLEITIKWTLDNLLLIERCMEKHDKFIPKLK